MANLPTPLGFPFRSARLTTTMPVNELHNDDPVGNARTRYGDYQSTPRQHHPGRFPDLSGFVIEPQFDYGAYRSICVERPRPGDIIYIISKDVDGAHLHNRVMLVVRTFPSSAMTCVPFCLQHHRRRDRAETYWPVSGDDRDLEPTDQPSSPPARMRDHRKETVRRIVLSTASIGGSKTLFIELDQAPQLNEGLAINLTELWHVECEHVSPDIIGCVSDRSWNPLLTEISSLFASSLASMISAQESDAESKKSDSRLRQSRHPTGGYDRRDRKTGARDRVRC